MVRPVVIFLLVLRSVFSFSQSSTGRQVLSRMEKENWTKAEQILSKALNKDSVNVEAKYLTSQLFFHPKYPKHQLDSSHRYILAAIAGFSKMEVREKERLVKSGIDSTKLIVLEEKIDSTAYALAKAQNTETSYNEYLAKYPTSANRSSAIELRDEAAFIDALKINSYKSFGQFLNKYPASHRASDARSRFDKLIFEDRTRGGTLRSYENFVTEIPESPYRHLAEKEIFEISTASGSTETFSSFLKKFPASPYARYAVDILFHLENNFTISHKELLTDSLRDVLILNSSYWVPIIKSGRYGFIDKKGEEKFPAELDSIHVDYICGDVRTDYLLTSNGVIARNRKLIFKGPVTNIEDLGNGFLWIESKNKFHLIHKSGKTIQQEDILDAFMLNERFLAIQKKSGWGIVTLTGRQLLSFSYENIGAFDNWIVLTKNAKKVIVTADQLASVADKVSLPAELVFDDVKRWAEDLCWVRNGALEGVINEKLEFVIPLDRQSLSKTNFGFLKKKNGEFFIEGMSEFQNTPFQSVSQYGQWLVVQPSGKSKQLLNVSNRKKTDEADSIWFDKNIAWTSRADSVIAWLNATTRLAFAASAKAKLFSKDSTAWIVGEEKNKKAVYDALSGQKLFVSDFETIESPAVGYFLVAKGNKKGLLDDKGKVILPIEYDAIIQTLPGRLSLLKEKKFGLFDLATRKLIKPTYERNVNPYNSTLFTAFKEGAWGFINMEAKPVGKFLFQEIQYWNDTSAWVKENATWKIFDIKNQKALVEDIKDFQYIKKYPHEHQVIVHQDNAYGVLSNRQGTVIPISFTSLINLGDADTPLFFTEKHVAEADIFVVIYYDSSGKLIRRQAFDGDEYERIFCEDN